MLLLLLLLLPLPVVWLVRLLLMRQVRRRSAASLPRTVCPPGLLLLRLRLRLVLR